MARLKAPFVCMALFLLLLSPKAFAYNEFQRVFLKSYATPKAKELRTLARKAKCNICHQGKEDRTFYNVYGEAMKPLLGEEDKKDKKKIAESLKKIAAMKVDPDDPDSETFGDRIAAQALPGGPLEESLVEPPGAKKKSDEKTGG